MSFQVQIEAFEGPFDLLLHLILKEDVDLYEIRLSEIVDAYLAELERLQSCDLEVATEFLLIAATLVELKCRRLLPDDDGLDLDEELGLWEERDLLLARLLECKTFKDASKVLVELMAVADRSVARQTGMEDAFLDLTPDPLAGVTPDRLRSAFLRAVVARPEPEVSLDHVTPVRANVTDALAELIDELAGSDRPRTFRSLTQGLEERVEIVVRFLAVLELFKQGVVELEQVANFAELTVRWVGHSTDPDMVLAGADDYEG